MTPIGRLHPLLVHFPIALVLTAGAAEIAATVTRAGHWRAYWRAIAVANLRAGALMAVATVIAGLELASASFEEVASSLVWHRGAGVVATLAAIVTALVAGRSVSAYRAMLLVTVVLMTITAHLGASLVWGSSFLWP